MRDKPSEGPELDLFRAVEQVHVFVYDVLPGGGRLEAVARHSQQANACVEQHDGHDGHEHHRSHRPPTSPDFVRRPLCTPVHPSATRADPSAEVSEAAPRTTKLLDSAAWLPRPITTRMSAHTAQAREIL